MGILFTLLFLIPFSTLATMIAWAGFYREPKKIGKYALFYIYGVFILSYSLIPDHELDLNRYWYQIEAIKSMTLQGAMEYFNDGLFVENFTFWIISKLQAPHLLPAISTSIVYGVSTYIIIDANKRLGIRDALIYAILFQSLVFPYLSIVSNVRNICAFSIGIAAVYRELVKKKRDIITIVAYISPVFMHKTGLLILLVRLMMVLFQKAPLLSVSIVALLPSIISFFYNNISLIKLPGMLGIVMRRLIISSQNYLVGGSDYAERLSKNLAASLAKYAAIVCILVQAYLLYKFYKDHKENILSKFAIFSFLMSMIAIATTVFDTPAYWRFGMAVNMSFSPVLLYYLSVGKHELRLNPAAFKILMFLLAGIRFAIEALRSIPRINLGESLNLLMYSNLYTIIFDVLRNI